jgi:phage terminase large subunit-like protein
VVVDGVWTWHRSGYERTLDEVAAVAKRYGVRTVRTDQYSSQPVLEGLQKRKLNCEAVPWDNTNKFEAFTRLKAGLVTRQISLPADDLLMQELMNLEAKPTVTGLVRIAASSGHHDDRAVVVAALMDLLENDLGPLVIDRRLYNTADSMTVWDAWADDAMLPDIA